jgi:hypothetical protein
MLYVVHKDGNEDYVCTTDTIDFHEELRKNGAAVLNESSFIPIIPSLKSSDVVMIHVGLGQEATRMGLKHFPGRKLLFTIDECKSDGVLFRTHRDFCEQIDCKEMILSYPSERNVKFLEEHGYKTLAYNPSNTVREKKPKKYDIIISGQMDRNYYPTRVHLAEVLLRNKQRWNVIHLPHPGFEISKATHQYTGEKYRELLDECKIGVACKAGWRDRLVAKYIELGASWCLPIGDAPSYMDEGMKNSMIVVDSSSSEDLIIRKIDEALENIDVRLGAYVSSLRRNHDLKTNVKNLVESLLKNV